MKIDKELNLYSLNDIIGVLKACNGKDWHKDCGYAFASDLTGLSIDKLWEMTEYDGSASRGGINDETFTNQS